MVLGFQGHRLGLGLGIGYGVGLNSMSTLLVASLVLFTRVKDLRPASPHNLGSCG